jgi:thiol-disulfide isomerase/thioredoxin
MRNRHFACAFRGLLVLLLIGQTGWVAGEDQPADDTYPRATLPSAAGGPLSLTAARGPAGTVLVCMSVECPISNEYIPTIHRLAESYRAKGIHFIGINPNAGQSLEDMAAHAREYKLAIPMVKDEGAKISRRLLFKVTPEVRLFDPQGQVVYQGRIDDRYRARGAAAGDVVRADLQVALDELLAGKPINNSRTKAIGCPLQLAAAPAPPARPGAVTYTKQIAPILQNHCQECHRKGGLAPFALTSYSQALSWAEDVRAFTANDQMPPWKPVEGFGEFKNRRSLSVEAKNLIARWVAEGCVEGDPAHLPEPRQFADTWRLAPPDLVLEPTADYHLAADGPDVYRNFILPISWDTNQYLSAVEFVPGNPRVVHHVLTFLDNSGTAEKLDARDPEAGYSSAQGLPGFIPLGGVAGVGGWAPGNTPGFLPPGVARVVPKGAKIIMQVHYHKNGKQEIDRTKVGIHFAKGPVKRALTVIPIMPPGGPLSGMTIPPRATDYEVRGSYTLPRDVLAFSVTPHMHYLGKDMKLTATLPTGEVVPLLLVRHWDFNWQEMYTYREPVPLPAGARIEMVAHFDNSEGNPNNPHRPPQAVRWGEETTDEMCIGFLDVAPQAEAASESELRIPSQADVVRFLFDSPAGEGNPGGSALKRFSSGIFGRRPEKRAK